MERYSVSAPLEQTVNSGGYRRAFDQSVDDREGFWLDAAKLVDWTVAPTTSTGGSLVRNSIPASTRSTAMCSRGAGRASP
jgi:hypothetical protein